MRKRIPMLSAAALAVCALVPAAASAATLSYEDGGYVYRAEGAERLDLLVTEYAGVNGEDKELAFIESAAGRLDVQTALCAKAEGHADMIFCAYDPNRPITIVGGEDADKISLASEKAVPDTVPVSIDGRGGDDQIKDTYDGNASRTLIGGAGNDKLLGYGGADTLEGGDGNDEVDGGLGNDIVRGGAGDDILWGDHYGQPGADVLDGGPGTDRVDEWTTPSGDLHPLPTVTLDGVANDGRPGENDNVIDVEQFDLHINGTFTGSDAAETVTIVNVADGAANLDGRGGNDILKAGDTPDTIDGGAGDDLLEGGFGNDTITGGPGKDNILGDSTASSCAFITSCKVPFGNDTINAQDGEVDQIDCGVGQDTAYVDAVDVVANCENVIGGASSGPGPDTGGGGATSNGGSTNGGKPGAKLSLSGSAKVKTLLGGKLKVGVPCATACRVTVKAKKGRTTVASGSVRLTKAGTAKVRLKVGAKSRRTLKQLKKLTLKVTATVTVGAKRQTLTRTFVLKK